MKSLELTKKYAYCREVKGLQNNNEPMLRIYRNSPCFLDLQVRTFGPTTETGKGTAKNMISGVGLTVEEVKILRDTLNEFIAEFE